MRLILQFNKTFASSQLADLVGGLLFSAEECWDFFAENMAPFTTSSSTSVTEVVSSNSDEKLVQSFMKDLANYMQSIKATQKYLVSFICSGIVDSCNKIVLFLNNAGTANCSCGRSNPFPSGCVPSCSGFRSCCSTKLPQYSI